MTGAKITALVAESLVDLSHEHHTPVDEAIQKLRSSHIENHIKKFICH